MAIELGAAYISILPSTDKLAPGITGEIDKIGFDKAGQKSGAKFGDGMKSKLGATLKGGLLAGTAAATTVVGTALVQGFKRLDAIDQAEHKLAGLGHSAGEVDKIMDNALSSVKGTAFGLGDAATVAASTVAAGIKPGKQLTTVLKTVADTATIAGASMGDMGAIFGSVAARGKLQGDDLMQLQSRGVPVLAFLAKHYGTTAAAASQMVTKGQVDFKNFAAAMKENLGGAALKSGDTFTGAFANMKASLGRIGANLLSGIFPQIKSGLAGLTAVFSSIEPVALTVGNAIGKGLTVATKAIGTFTGNIKGAFDALFGGGSVDKRLDSFADELDYAFGNTGKLAEPLGAAFGAIADAVSRLAPAFKSGFQQFLPTIQTMGNTFTKVVLPAVVSLAGYLGKTFLPILSDIGGIIGHNVVPIIATLGAFVYGKLYPALIKIWSAVAVKLKPVLDSLAQTFKSSILPTVKDALQQFQTWQPTIQRVVMVVAQFAGKLLVLAAAILGKVLPPAIRFAGFLIRTLVPAAVRIIGVAVKVVGAVVGIGVGFAKVVASIGSGIGKFVGFFKALPGKIGHAVSGMFDGLKNAFRSAINWIIDKWNGIHFSLPKINALGLHFGGGTIAVPQIPKLAKGGVLTKPTLNVAGEAGPEAVIPLSKLGSMLGSAAREGSRYANGGASVSLDGANFSLVLDDGTELTGYIADIADERVAAGGAMSGQEARAR